MKKCICVIIIGLMIFVLGKNNSYVLPNNAIRFRIIANSDSIKDILMKKKIQYEMASIIEDMKSDDIDEGRTNIIKNIESIENKIDVVFEKDNYDMDYSIKYGMNRFPEKVYKGIKYSEGDYESLVINIGDAKGDNFWCVLYPPLCMVDDESDVNYSFKIVDFLKKIFS